MAACIGVSLLRLLSSEPEPRMPSAPCGVLLVIYVKCSFHTRVTCWLNQTMRRPPHSKGMHAQIIKDRLNNKSVARNEKRAPGYACQNMYPQRLCVVEAEVLTEPATPTSGELTFTLAERSTVTVTISPNNVKVLLSLGSITKLGRCTENVVHRLQAIYRFRDDYGGRKQDEVLLDGATDLCVDLAGMGTFYWLRHRLFSVPPPMTTESSIGHSVIPSSRVRVSK